MTRVFYDLETEGLSKSKALPSSDEFDVATCCTLADIDFDGNQEILIGTYGELVLVYKVNTYGYLLTSYCILLRLTFSILLALLSC